MAVNAKLKTLSYNMYSRREPGSQEDETVYDENGIKVYVRGETRYYEHTVSFRGADAGHVLRLGVEAGKVHLQQDSALLFGETEYPNAKLAPKAFMKALAELPQDAVARWHGDKVPRATIHDLLKRTFRDVYSA